MISPTVVAADGTHLLLRGVKIGDGATTTWQVSVFDLTAGKISPGVDLPGGTDLPKITQISGDLVVGDDRQPRTARLENPQIVDQGSTRRDLSDSRARTSLIN